jgi:hypothetical protein
VISENCDDKDDPADLFPILSIRSFDTFLKDYKEPVFFGPVFFTRDEWERTRMRTSGEGPAHAKFKTSSGRRKLEG